MTVIRRPGATSATALILLSAALVAAHLLAPEWSARTGLDVWNLPSAKAELHAAAEERAEVNAGAERSAQRREAANHIAARLAAGTITLSVATDETMEVFRDDTGMPYILETVHRSAPTERHRYARHVIDRVQRILLNEPDRYAIVSQRLEREYRELHSSPEAPVGH